MDNPSCVSAHTSGLRTGPEADPPLSRSMEKAGTEADEAGVLPGAGGAGFLVKARSVGE